jgi:hypothetical protein
MHITSKSPALSFICSCAIVTFFRYKKRVGGNGDHGGQHDGVTTHIKLDEERISAATEQHLVIQWGKRAHSLQSKQTDSNNCYYLFQKEKRREEEKT